MRDCKHHKLARSCNECDLENELNSYKSPDTMLISKGEYLYIISCLKKSEELIENMITDATNDDTKNYTHKWLRAAAIYRREKENNNG